MAAARLGNRTALISGVGDDPFGRFVRAELARLGVDNRYVTVHDEYPTPVTFCEIFPPDDFPLYFYRKPSAPGPADPARRDRRWRPSATPGCTGRRSPDCPKSQAAVHISRRGQARGPGSADGARPRLPADVLGQSPADATEQVQRALQHVTVAVGNREECEIAVGETNPHKAADALLDLGVELAIVKQGPRGVLGKTKHSSVTVAAQRGRRRQRPRCRRLASAAA